MPVMEVSLIFRAPYKLYCVKLSMIIGKGREKNNKHHSIVRVQCNFLSHNSFSERFSSRKCQPSCTFVITIMTEGTVIAEEVHLLSCSRINLLCTAQHWRSHLSQVVLCIGIQQISVSFFYALNSESIETTCESTVVHYCGTAHSM